MNLIRSNWKTKSQCVKKNKASQETQFRSSLSTEHLWTIARSSQGTATPACASARDLRSDMIWSHISARTSSGCMLPVKGSRYGTKHTSKLKNVIYFNFSFLLYRYNAAFIAGTRCMAQMPLKFECRVAEQEAFLLQVKKLRRWQACRNFLRLSGLHFLSSLKLLQSLFVEWIS